VTAREVLDGIKARGRYMASSTREERARFRADYARLTEAVDAVLALHTEDLFRGHLCNGCQVCGNGENGYPCPTVAAIENALKEPYNPGEDIKLSGINLEVAQ
jgi:hypothetical protein